MIAASVGDGIGHAGNWLPAGILVELANPLQLAKGPGYDVPRAQRTLSVQRQYCSVVQLIERLQTDAIQAVDLVFVSRSIN